MILLKNYNYKLCRKGLLERGNSVNKSFGNFKDIENKFIKSTTAPDYNINDLLQQFKKEKSDAVNNELKQLGNALEALNRTMNNIKKEIKEITDERSYTKWTERINIISGKFKVLYSQEANDLYNHLFKMDGKLEGVLIDSEKEIKFINNNICCPFKKRKNLHHHHC